MPKINREIAARPLVNGDSWWLSQKQCEGFTALAVSVFALEEPPSAIAGIAWQQQAAWDKKKAS